jgi:hypothetical protein
MKGDKQRMDGLEMPANAEKKQESHKFTKGRSGNPKGKIKGTKNKATVVAEMLLHGELENICRRLIQEAITGNMQAIKMVLDRVLPAKRDSPIVIDLPKLEKSSDALQAIASITMAVSKGKLTVSEGESLSKIIDIYVKAIEMHDCEIRINRVEQKAIS